MDVLTSPTYNDTTLSHQSLCLFEIRQIALLVSVDEDEIERCRSGLEFFDRIASWSHFDCHLARQLGKVNVLLGDLKK